MTARITLHGSMMSLPRAAGASCVFLMSAAFGVAALQQGEFVPQKSVASQRQALALEHPAVAVLQTQTTKTPDLIKRSLQDAQNILQESKLLMGIPQFVSSPAPSGTVLRQYPEAGSPIRIGASVLVWASQQPPKTPQAQPQPPQRQPDYTSVPDLLGLDESQARAVLNKYGLSTGSVNQIATNDQRPGLVIAQDPKAKTRVLRGSLVAISLATPRLVPVPSLLHHQKDDAIRILQLVGLQATPAAIGETTSEEETGIVLSQDPPPETLVVPETTVSFKVSRQIERKLGLRASAKNIAPGESVVLSAELDPPFPGAEYQFSIGSGDLTPGPWSSDAQARFANLSDGDYEAIATARWNNRSVTSNRLHIVVHSIKYEVRLLPGSLHLRPDESVSFGADVSPAVKSATYIFHFGYGIADQTSSSPDAQYAYQTAGKYSAQVTVRIADMPAAGGATHLHEFPSPPVELLVQRGPLVPFYVLGTAALLAAGYAVRKWLRKPRVAVAVRKDFGIQTVEIVRQGRSRVGIEIHVVRSWGEQTIESQGPLWARIESTHE